MALVLSVAVVASLLGGALTTEDDFVGSPESKVGEELIDERIGDSGEPEEIVVVRSATRDVGDPAFQARVISIAAEVERAAGPAFEGLAHYYGTGDESLVSEDRRATIVAVQLDEDDGPDHIEDIENAVTAARGQDGFETYISGTFSLDSDFEQVAQDDLQTGETFGIAIALIVLLLVFGTLVASILPVLMAIASITVALAITSLVGQAFTLSFFVVNMLVMMGLAVGIDYSLFVVSRFREERAAGREVPDAVGVAGRTASKAVFFSGLTVVLALLGMFIVPTTIFMSLATGAIIVVLVSVVAALTLLPAMLRLLGDRVDAGKIPFLYRRPTADSVSRGFFARLARGVMRAPVVSLLASVAVLVVLMIPAFSISTGFSGVETLPASFESKRGFEVLQGEFPAGSTSPAFVVVDGDVGSPAVQGAVGDLEARLASDPEFGPPERIGAPEDDLLVLSLPMRDEAGSDAANEAIRALRSDDVPAAFDGAEGIRVYVTGETAGNVDFVEITDRCLPVVIVVVLALSFVLLLIAFRSVVVPLTSIVMNLLSVGAAYGLIVLVFQEGYGNEFFGFRQVEVIEAWIPLFLFSVLFGLSMDYHVFLLSRIRERYLQTGSNRESVAFGVASTARLITGAALIMVAVFGGFAAGQLSMFQQMGFGLAVAVLLDATLIRSVLVPSVMTLLGDRNWYFPRWLEWVPRVDIGEGGDAGARAGAPEEPALAPPGGSATSR
jgi:RND superfamily putative drug exporter